MTWWRRRRLGRLWGGPGTPFRSGELDVLKQDAARQAHAAEGIDATELLGWPKDVLPPVFGWFDATVEHGVALCDRWVAEVKGPREIHIAELRVDLDAHEVELDKLGERISEVKNGIGPDGRPRRTRPLVGELLNLVVLAAAAGADVVILRTVFQFVDQSLTDDDATILGVAISAIIMISGIVIGRVGRATHRGIEEGEPPKPVRAGLALMLAVAVTVTATLLGLLRASVVEPSSESQSVLGLSPEVLAALTFVAIQLSTLGAAIASAYYGFRHRGHRDDEFRSVRSLEFAAKRVRRAVRMTRRRIDQLQKEVAVIDDVYTASRREFRAAVEAERRRAAIGISAQGGLAGHVLVPPEIPHVA